MERDKVGEVYYGDFELSVNRLVGYFIKKHDLGVGEGYWIGGIVGGVFEINDEYIDFTDVEADVRLNAPSGLYEQYRNDLEEYVMSGGTKKMNYSSYIRGLRFNNV